MPDRETRLDLYGDDADREEESPWEWQICALCHGSGEGRWDGSICPQCRGLGEVKINVEAS